MSGKILLYAKSSAKLRNFLLCDFVYLILHGFGKAGVVAVGAGRHLVPVAQSHVKAALGAAVLALAGLFTRIYGMCHNLPPDTKFFGRGKDRLRRFCRVLFYYGLTGVRIYARFFRV